MKIMVQNVLFGRMFIAVLGMLLPFYACSYESEFEKRAREDDRLISEYLSVNNIIAEKTSKGLYYKSLVSNLSGRPAVKDQVVSILYAMKRLPEEELVDIFADSLNPVRFQLTPGSVIPEIITDAVGRMREGETFRFFIPSTRAFGEYAHYDLFGVYANFIVDITLLEVLSRAERFEQEQKRIERYVDENDLKGVYLNDGLFIQQIIKGNGNSPGTHSQVRFHFTKTYLDGTIIASSRDGDPLYEYLDQGAMAIGLEMGIKMINEGGSARLILSSEEAFDKSLQVIPIALREVWVADGNLSNPVLPFSPIIYEIDLLEVY